MNIISLVLAATLVASGHVGLSQHQPVDASTLRDNVSVRMRQALTFTFEQRGDRLVSPHAVHGRTNQPTVTVELTDEAPGMSTLLVTSTYPKTLQYRGAAHFRGKSGFVATTAYPVHPNAPDGQGFREPVDEFVLWDLRLTK